MRIFLSGSFKLCGDIFDHLEDTFKYVGEVVRMDRFWASQTLYDTTNWSKDKFWEIDCRCLSNCDVVIFCGDWMKHEGCRMEYERAKTEGKTILYAENASPAPKERFGEIADYCKDDVLTTEEAARFMTT